MCVYAVYKMCVVYDYVFTLFVCKSNLFPCLCSYTLTSKTYTHTTIIYIHNSTYTVTIIYDASIKRWLWSHFSIALHILYMFCFTFYTLRYVYAFSFDFALAIFHKSVYSVCVHHIFNSQFLVYFYLLNENIFFWKFQSDNTNKCFGVCFFVAFLTVWGGEEGECKCNKMWNLWYKMCWVKKTASRKTKCFLFAWLFNGTQK